MEVKEADRFVSVFVVTTSAVHSCRSVPGLEVARCSSLTRYCPGVTRRHLILSTLLFFHLSSLRTRAAFLLIQVL